MARFRSSTAFASTGSRLSCSASGAGLFQWSRRSSAVGLLRQGVVFGGSGSGRAGRRPDVAGLVPPHRNRRQRAQGRKRFRVRRVFVSCPGLHGVEGWSWGTGWLAMSSWAAGALRGPQPSASENALSATGIACSSVGARLCGLGGRFVYSAPGAGRGVTRLRQAASSMSMRAHGQGPSPRPPSVSRSSRPPASGVAARAQRSRGHAAPGTARSPAPPGAFPRQAPYPAALALLGPRAPVVRFGEVGRAESGDDGTPG